MLNAEIKRLLEKKKRTAAIVPVTANGVPADDGSEEDEDGDEEDGDQEDNEDEDVAIAEGGGAAAAAAQQETESETEEVATGTEEAEEEHANNVAQPTADCGGSDAAQTEAAPLPPSPTAPASP